MLLKEKNFTIFHELSLINENTQDIKIFDYVFPDTLDTTFNILFSNRKLTVIGETKTSSEIARIVYDAFNYYWNLIIDVNESALSLIKIGGKSTENTEDVPIAYSRTITHEKASYNTQEFQNEERETEEYTPSNTETSHYSKTITTTNGDNIAKAKTVLQSNIIYDTIFRDVNRVISLMIIESEV